MIFNFLKGSQHVQINGQSFSGNTVKMENGKLWIDGKLTEYDACNDKIINVVVHGDCGSCSTSQGDITINGNVVVADEVKTSQGNIKISGNVTGNVKTSQGNVNIGGYVSGNVKTSMGNITYKK